MAQEWAKPFYDSERWKRCRRAFIAERILQDGGMCQECGLRPGTIVHHRVTLTKDNINDVNISLSFDNLELVCHTCHDLFEGHGLRHRSVKPLCTFDEKGQPVSLREIDRDIPP